jgi:hypothetical protein
MANYDLRLVSREVQEGPLALYSNGSESQV